MIEFTAAELDTLRKTIEDAIDNVVQMIDSDENDPWGFSAGETDELRKYRDDLQAILTKIPRRPQPTVTSYIAVGAHCWGVGHDKVSAKRRARQEGRPFEAGYAVYENEHPVDAPPSVHPMGYLQWYGRGRHVAGPDIAKVGKEWATS